MIVQNAISISPSINVRIVQFHFSHLSIFSLAFSRNPFIKPNGRRRYETSKPMHVIKISRNIVPRLRVKYVEPIPIALSELLK